jgi:catechol 2,3-dioxygenase-like lactoylglutathione lyase family enzyme
MLTDLLHHSAQILHVKSIDDSLHFYRDLLDFSVEFLWEDPPSYAIIKANKKIQIHLSKLEKQLTLPPRAVMYIFVEEVDMLFQKYEERNVPIHHPIGDRDYKMRDFDVIDPDGHVITFGCGT